MKLKPEINISAFMQAVQTCRGEIYFVTPEGDCLNLKSTLMKFVFVTVFADKLRNQNGRIEVQNPQDLIRLRDYFVQEGM
ncbi:MAG: hypothetical protein HDR27_09780 [Lachnospiraceae bacterium]|nr:hypothetical protein [Lachnospiraceae bacterium]